MLYQLLGESITPILVKIRNINQTVFLKNMKEKRIVKTLSSKTQEHDSSTKENPEIVKSFQKPYLGFVFDLHQTIYCHSFIDKYFIICLW